MNSLDELLLFGFAAAVAADEPPSPTIVNFAVTRAASY